MTTIRDQAGATPHAHPTDRVLHDEYPVESAAGELLGTVGPYGAVRLGIDREGRIGADNGSLRIGPLARPGWGRCGVAYGPLTRRPGRVLAVHVLNGHNASMTWFAPETARQRAKRWLRDGLRLRFRRKTQTENLAVGWFPSQAPRHPDRCGNGFVMQAAKGDNAELWATVAGHPLRVARGIQDLDIVYVVALRERGAAYYTMSVPGAAGLGAYPKGRPVAIDPFDSSPELYPGVHQAILGEVGYRADTRVRWVTVNDDEELAGWYSTAMIADRLRGSGPLAGTSGDAGPAWSADGDVHRTTSGATTRGSGHAVVDAGAPAGLVHALVLTGPEPAAAALTWRGSVAGGWRFEAGPEGCELAVGSDVDGWNVLAVDGQLRLTPQAAHSLQVVDDGETFCAYLDGVLAFGRWTADERNRQGCGAGFVLRGPGTTVADFEAHPHAVPLPIDDSLPAPWLPVPGAVVVDERFDACGPDLDGVVTPSGRRRWERSEGRGTIDLPGAPGAAVRASVARPNPGRTLYTIPWEDWGSAELSIELTPPGSRRGEGEECRVGVVLWQDAQNYLVANVFLDNDFDGASISTFFRCQGHENMYDAVWTLVRGVEFGAPCTLRVACDGSRFLASLNGRPSLHRAFTDVYPNAPALEIRRVGVVVNEEWGDDTGTRIHRFVAGTLG